RPLSSLCVARLREALNLETAVFDRQLRGRRWAATRGTEDLTGTAIALISLSRAAVPPGEVGLDPARTIKALDGLARPRRYLGGLGLVLWANAVADGAPPGRVLGLFGLATGELPPRAGALSTMELSWLLSGLAHALAQSPSRDVQSAFASALGSLIGRF